MRTRQFPSAQLRSLLFRASLLCSVVIFSSCDRRLLEEYDYNYAQVRIDVDWDSYFTETPSGMTVMLFDADGRNPNTSITNNIRSTTFTLGSGHYQTVIFNQSFDEFGSLRFEQTDDHKLIAARSTNIVTRENGQWDQGVVYMREPEAIGVAIDTFSITRDMLSQYITLHPHQPITRSIPEMSGDGTYVVRDTVYPMTSKLYIRVHVKGLQNLRAIEGSISGMANGFYLSQLWRTRETGTLLLDNWESSKESSDGTVGWLNTVTPTFGLPHGKELEAQRDNTDNVIILHITLRDGSTRDYSFNVGKDIKYRNEEKLINEYGELIAGLTLTAHAEVILDLDLELIIDIELPDVEPSSDGGGGFDAHVDEWEDGGTIDIGGF